MISKKVKINCSFKQRLNSVNVLFHLSYIPNINCFSPSDRSAQGIWGIWAFPVDVF